MSLRYSSLTHGLRTIAYVLLWITTPTYSVFRAMTTLGTLQRP